MSERRERGSMSERRIRLGSNYWKLFTASLISNTGDGMGLIAYP